MTVAVEGQTYFGGEGEQRLVVIGVDGDAITLLRPISLTQVVMTQAEFDAWTAESQRTVTIDGLGRRVITTPAVPELGIEAGHWIDYYSGAVEPDPIPPPPAP